MVFEQLWIIKGRPEGNGRYGEESFNNNLPYQSTLQQKAEAIECLLRKYGVPLKPSSYDRKKSINFEMEPRPNFDGTYRLKAIPAKEWIPDNQEDCEKMPKLLMIGTAVMAVVAFLANLKK